MKTFKKLIPALILVSVVAFIAIAFPSVIHNIIQDAITKR